ncbi:hypothetical protein, partial [Nonomuraea sp. NPDC003804]|uniref:hypothetical protein n=1 Tax=Nonomuraea sp. NPDC003804 TaxID=3154547 RepID=UPI0033A86C2B
AWRYGDADTPDIPVISQTTGGQAALVPQGARLQPVPGAGRGVPGAPGEGQADQCGSRPR